MPQDARTPEVRTSNSDDSPIARLALVANPGVEVDLETLGNFLETQVVEPLGRVNGVAEVTFFGSPIVPRKPENNPDWPQTPIRPVAATVVGRTIGRKENKINRWAFHSDVLRQHERATGRAMIRARNAERKACINVKIVTLVR
ncbi:efflux RND transporter permease subunit [Alphaproteobacteria bacterium]|nr:efflux RND transporter permease subunit [Alphaproteobacteria bacterium]